MVNGITLPEERYGKLAVSRGDSATRLITLRNLSWLPITVPIKLDASVGLQSAGDVEVLQYHPVEKFLGTYPSGSVVNVTVMPFHVSLIKISTRTNPEIQVKGASSRVIKYLPNHPSGFRFKSRNNKLFDFRLSS